MKRLAKVYLHNKYTGTLQQDEEGYSFTYSPDYLNSNHPVPISLTLPLKNESYRSKSMIPFFDGLIPEGWYLDVDKTELSMSDRMSLLLSLCKDCIGAISILPEEEENDG